MPGKKPIASRTNPVPRREGLPGRFRMSGEGIGIVSLFERRPWTHAAINGGYVTVALVLMGAILGAWR